LLTISAFCVAGDAIWISLGQPEVLARTIVSDSVGHRFLVGLLILSSVVRIVCFAMLARWGFCQLVDSPSSSMTSLPRLCSSMTNGTSG
jgi:hypothetical protein